MVDIRLISRFTKKDLDGLGKYGFNATEKYIVEKYSCNNELIFRLRKEALKSTLNKDWDKLDSDFDFYNSIIKQGFSFGAYINNELVGVVIGEHVKWNNTLFIRMIHIVDKHHNKGIGSLLIGKIKETAITNNIRIIALEVQNTNINAIEFYKKNGFSIDGFDLSLYDNNYPNNEVAFYMKWNYDSGTIVGQ